jgi:hypothetical protein
VRPVVIGQVGDRHLQPDCAHFTWRERDAGERLQLLRRAFDCRPLRRPVQLHYLVAHHAAGVGDIDRHYQRFVRSQRILGQLKIGIGVCSASALVASASATPNPTRGRLVIDARAWLR